MPHTSHDRTMRLDIQSTANAIEEANKSMPLSILVANFSKKLFHLPKHMRVEIALPVPDTIYESNQPTFYNETKIGQKRSISNPEVNAIHTDNIIKIELINGTNSESCVTAELVPFSVIQLEPDVERIAVLSSTAVDGNNKSS